MEALCVVTLHTVFTLPSLLVMATGLYSAPNLEPLHRQSHRWHTPKSMEAPSLNKDTASY